MKYLCYVSYFLQFVYIVLILNDAAIIFLFQSNFSLLLQIAAELEFLKSHAIFVFFVIFLLPMKVILFTFFINFAQMKALLTLGKYVYLRNYFWLYAKWQQDYQASKFFQHKLYLSHHVEYIWLIHLIFSYCTILFVKQYNKITVNYEKQGNLSYCTRLTCGNQIFTSTKLYLAW